MFTETYLPRTQLHASDETYGNHPPQRGEPSKRLRTSPHFKPDRPLVGIKLGKRHRLLVLVHHQEDPGTLLLELSAEEVSRLVQVVRRSAHDLAQVDRIE